MTTIVSHIQRLAAAIRGVADGRLDNHVLFHKEKTEAADYIADLHGKAGFGLMRAYEDAFLARISPHYPPADPASFLDMLYGYGHDYTEDFWAHVGDRLKAEGNVVLEITGPSGTAKSSCMIGFLDRLSRMQGVAITPQNLLDHVAVDLIDFMDKISRCPPGSAVILDEFLRQSGEGSRTINDVMRNQEDTSRKSRVSAAYISPRGRIDGGADLRLDAFLWNPLKRQTRFVFYLKEQPLGFVTLDWCRGELYHVYEPWKDAWVLRTRQGFFRPTKTLARYAHRLWEDPDFAEHMETLGKAKKSQVASAVRLFNRLSVTQGQEDGLAQFLIDSAMMLTQAAAKFERIYEVQPNAAWKSFAARFYEE